jgi:hypothetical protein
MTETLDTGDKSLENSTHNEPEKLSDKNISSADPVNITLNQETYNMETHANHLHHAPGNNLWHYFFEFLMLFIAVFCGFLAENWREQMVEHHREKEFMHSIVQDIKSDILQSNEVLIGLKITNAGVDSLIDALSSPEIIKNSNKAYRLWTNYATFPDFFSNDRTIEQLKNSGGLLLIRNRSVSDSIMKYDQEVRDFELQHHVLSLEISDQHIVCQLFDWISLNRNENVPVPLTEQGEKILNEAYSNRIIWNFGISAIISRLEKINEEGKRIVVFIQKEYHLE